MAQERSMRSRRRVLSSALAGLFFVSTASFGCGPDFPNTLLDRGEQPLLNAPEVRFQAEIERMKLVAPTHRAKPAADPVWQSIEADMADLRLALSKADVPVETRESIVQSHKEQRERLERLAEALVSSLTNKTGQPKGWTPDSGPRPQIVPGLPGEFADYFRGAIAWHSGEIAEARSAWTALLKRPPAERPFKSTWAAFMLGKSWEDEDGRRAAAYYQSVRSLAQAGFADSLGLAASSLGWEARLHLRGERFAPAIDLYLEQAASGDPTAITSLRWVASGALERGALRALATHPRAQRVITAYVIAGGWAKAPRDVDSSVREATLHLLEKAASKASILPAPKPSWHNFKRPVLLWLEAVEAASVNDVDSAEVLALAAYQAGEMETAQRWLNRARSTPVAQWLQAKLYLRAGKVDAAASLLAQVCKLFPLEPSDTNHLAKLRLADSLYLENGGYETVSVAQQVRGELGVFNLARRQYNEALDTLLRSGYWMDAAYVAERVLTLDELKAFVDRHWPAEPQPPDAVPTNRADPAPTTYQFHQLAIGEKLRYLLARRLTRANRTGEARSYYPVEARPMFETLVSALNEAQQSDRPAETRAKAYFDAARLMRRSGLELAGTEVEPDWAIHDGQFEEGVSVTSRATLQSSAAVPPSADELDRAGQHVPQPELRWHYRYKAAALAWEAAKLMPNNSEDTARVLCIGGSWIKRIDPILADPFYKALVRRCRKTNIGAEADRLRWFPTLDEDGNLRDDPVNTEPN